MKTRLQHCVNVLLTQYEPWVTHTGRDGKKKKEMKKILLFFFPLVCVCFLCVCKKKIYR